MNLAYVDPSCFVSVACGEPGYRKLIDRLRGHDRLFSSILLEAELRAALRREEVPDDPTALLSWVSWFYPDRPLTSELQIVLSEGATRGADLWHLACALYLKSQLPKLTFLTADDRQRSVAQRLGLA
jgi:hypothetical protein